MAAWCLLRMGPVAKSGLPTHVAPSLSRNKIATLQYVCLHDLIAEAWVGERGSPRPLCLRCGCRASKRSQVSMGEASLAFSYGEKGVLVAAALLSRPRTMKASQAPIWPLKYFIPFSLSLLLPILCITQRSPWDVNDIS